MARNPFRRSVEVPASVRETACLRRGEKVLAAAEAGDGSWLLGTRDALLIVRPSGVASEVERAPVVEPVETRIPWEQVERADWQRDSERLTVVEVGRFGQVRPQHTFEIVHPGSFLELVRERVTASVVLQRRVVVSGKQGLSVIARRPPRGDGEITWAYEFDSGVDPEDSAVMAAAEQGLRVAAEELGL